jgi:hypothetical protein
MRKLQVIYLIFMLAVCSSCKKDDADPSILNISITQQPTGGNRIFSVAIKFEGQISGPQKTIEAIGEWWWCGLDNAEPTLFSSTEFDFNSNSSTSYSSHYYHPSNLLLNHQFWFRITWTDDKGQHILESAKVNCTL